MQQIDDINALLGQMRAMAADLQAGSGELRGTSGGGRFGELMQQAVENVNAAQQRASAAARDYESGASNASIAEVMLDLEKASLAFRAMTEVRNRLVSAYQEIMNMPV